MDSGGFKVPVSAVNLGRRKKILISEKDQTTDDQAEEKNSKATLNRDEARPEISGNHEVSASREACADSDLDGQSSLDRGVSEAEPPGGARGEIKDEKSSHDATDLPVDIDSTVREDTSSSSCDRENETPHNSTSSQ